jgi:hypothetical protein
MAVLGFCRASRAIGVGRVQMELFEKGKHR